MIPKGGKRKMLKRTRKTVSESRLNSEKIIYSLQEENDVIKEEMFKKEEYDIFIKAYICNYFYLDIFCSFIIS